MDKPRVVITGVSLRSALGDSPEKLQKELMKGTYGFRTKKFIGGNDFGFGAFFDEVEFPDWIQLTQRPFLGPLSLLSLTCAREALWAAGFDVSHLSLSSPSTFQLGEKWGVIVGSGMLNLSDLESNYRDYFIKQRPVAPSTIPKFMANAAANQVSLQFGTRGTCHMLASACSSGSSAVAEAVHLIRSGRQEGVICGGVDLLGCETLYHCWKQMRVLSPETEHAERACLPFDEKRKGLVLGDGAAFFILESLQSAQKRSAPILAEVKGVFQNSDSYHIVKPSVEGISKCMSGALHDAQMNPDEIRSLQCHGTGTLLNDQAEWEAIGQVWGQERKNVNIAAIKGQIGHTIGASGCLALAAALGTLSEGYVYPIPNYQSFGSNESGKNDLPRIVTSGNRDPSIQSVMVNAFAFGGTNASLIVSRM